MLAFVLAVEKPPFKRSMTPRVGGVEIPPRRPPSRPEPISSPPPVDQDENVLHWLRRVSEQGKAQHQEVMHELAETRRDVDVLERRMNLVERAVLRVDTLDAKFDNLRERLFENREQDMVTRGDVAKIKLELTKAVELAAETTGEDAGRAAAKSLTKKYGWLGALAVLVASYADKWGPAVWELLNQ
jgi:hypothetical protein